MIPESSPDVIGARVCMMSTLSIEDSQDTEMRNNDTESSATTASLASATSQTPFLYPPAGLVPQQIFKTVVLPNISFVILVWYLIPPSRMGSAHVTTIGLKPLNPKEVPPI